MVAAVVDTVVVVGLDIGLNVAAPISLISLFGPEDLQTTFIIHSIPSMQRLLNKAERERSDMMKQIELTVPVNYGYYL